VENLRRIAEMAKLMVEAGRMARVLFAADEFIEIYVDTPQSTRSATRILTARSGASNCARASSKSSADPIAAEDAAVPFAW
jgi:hypothetical protein